MTAVEQQPWLTSSNPVLSGPRFSRRGGQKTAVGDPRAGVAVAWGRSGTGQDPGPWYDDDPAPLPLFVGDLMTMDDVLSRAATGLAVTFAAATLSWTLLPYDVIGTAAAYGIAVGAALAAAALVVVQRRANRPSPALTLAFAAFQGVFLSVLSTTVSRHVHPGFLVQTVLATMAASCGCLLAYKLHWVRADRRFRAFAGAALLGLCLLAFANWLLISAMGADGLGLRPAGLGVVMGLLGVVLATTFLSLHFRKVEDGITCGAPRDQSWTSAFGVTLTLAWLYVETVRLLTLFPADDVY
ncbi:Integral membrane protein [Actinacidiphila cocklensis]|uniref:Integral membrane protein n=1 Tax=Actinacidiphila cocklensis TaxID=887465 RepID=A0A9W4GMV3_9ACTN|nr:Integral membrane protein [Actinacidiphila cocklensis]